MQIFFILYLNGFGLSRGVKNLNILRSSWLSERSLRRLSNLVAVMKVNQSALQLLDTAEDVTDGSGDVGVRTQVPVISAKVSLKDKEKDL